MKERIVRIFDEHARLQREFLKHNTEMLEKVSGLLIQAFRKGRTVYFFGNGGSAADAQHLAAEFVNRFRLDRRALPALALNVDTSVLTSIANDFGYDRIFARQIEALGHADDVAVGLSTSGASPNVIEGIRLARRQGLVTVGFSGGDGGALLRETDHCIVVPSNTTARVQEMHILAGHVICDIVEQDLVHPTHETR
ncbi:MAG: D-sedoheptulose-7-phosphate isomerase [Candidatus Methylomirabilia bacterium]